MGKWRLTAALGDGIGSFFLEKRHHDVDVQLHGEDGEEHGQGAIGCNTDQGIIADRHLQIIK